MHMPSNARYSSKRMYSLYTSSYISEFFDGRGEAPAHFGSPVTIYFRVRDRERGSLV